MTRRTFIVFDGAFPAAADGLQLLGRVVLDPRKPLACYRPRTETPSPPSEEHIAKGLDQIGNAESKSPTQKRALKSVRKDQLKTVPIAPPAPSPDPFLPKFHLRPITDKRTTIRAQSIKTITARLNFTNLLFGSRTTLSRESLTLRATSFQTFCLEQHPDIYDTLVAQYSADLDELMALQAEGRPLYLMVSLKTATGLRVLTSDEERREQVLEAEVPLEKAVVAAGGPPGVGSALGNVGAGFSRKVSRKEALQLVAAEERAIAAEYCEIERTPKARFSLRQKKGTGSKPTSRFKNEISFFSGDHTSFNPKSESEGRDKEESDEEIYR